MTNEPVDDDELLNNMGLIGANAKRFPPNAVCDYYDYVQTGALVLWKILHRYDPAKGKLSTYAYRPLRQNIGADQYAKFSKPKIANKKEYVYDRSPLWEILPDNLTELELQVITLLAEGHTLRQLKVELKLSPKNIKAALRSGIDKVRMANADE